MLGRSTEPGGLQLPSVQREGAKRAGYAHHLDSGTRGARHRARQPEAKERVLAAAVARADRSAWWPRSTARRAAKRRRRELSFRHGHLGQARVPWPARASTPRSLRPRPPLTRGQGWGGWDRFLYAPASFSLDPGCGRGADTVGLQLVHGDRHRLRVRARGADAARKVTHLVGRKLTHPAV
jgi:hypothetical protein